jgi:hypothetical protein
MRPWQYDLHLQLGPQQPVGWPQTEGEQLGGKRLRLNDDQRRRLPAKARMLGRRILREVATIVTPETLLAWHRKIAHKV